jgi:hypothetical protein
MPSLSGRLNERLEVIDMDAPQAPEFMPHESALPEPFQDRPVCDVQSLSDLLRGEIVISHVVLLITRRGAAHPSPLFYKDE